ELIEATYTFGNENIANQYRKMQYDALQDVHDILNGRKPIPYSVLPKAVREATAIINAGDSTQFYYQEDGIYGFNKDNPNWSVRMNANGLGYSVDGGRNYNNAITHLGVVTEALTAGTIDANRVTIYGDRQTNRVEINGDHIKVWDSSEPDKYTLLSAGTALFSKNITILRNDGDPFIQDGHTLFDSPIIIREFAQSGEVEYITNSYQTSSSSFVNFERATASHSGRWANFSFQPGMSYNSTSNSAHIEVEIAVTNAPTGVDIATVRHRQTIYRDRKNNSFVLNMPLPRVTYGALSFILRFKLDSAYNGNAARIRSGRAWISG